MRFFTLLVLLLSIGCGSHPLSWTEEQKLQEVREFFADALMSQPAAEKPLISFKTACFNHLEAIYFAINNPEVLEKSGVPTKMLGAVPKDFSELKGESLEKILTMLTAQPDSFFLENQTKLDKAVTDFQFSLEQFKAIQLPKLGKSWTGFFQKILNNYFPELVLEDKKRILAFMIRHLKTNPSEIDALLNWVYASGPYFQKYLQLMVDYLEVGDDLKLKTLKEGLEKVKSQLPPIHPYYLKVYLQKLHHQGIDLEDLKSLGAASVGEAFSARIKSTGQKIVIKFKRPGIEEIADRERVFFEKQAKEAQGDALRASFQQISDQIKEEFDYRKEIKKIDLGITAYENDSEFPIKVVRYLKDFPNTKDYFAMEFIDGKTFEQIGKTPLESHAKNILWERVARKFMKQAIIASEDAFFHGDLHGGNIMVTFPQNPKLRDNLNRKQVQKAIDKGLIQVVLIDFGNAHALSQEERVRLKNIFFAAAKVSNSPRAFLHALLPEGYADRLRTYLEKTAFHYDNREKLPPEKIGEAMDFILVENIAIPGFLMAFKRSAGMLMKIYEKHLIKDTDLPSLDNIFQSPYTQYLSDYTGVPTLAGLFNFISFIDNTVIGGEAWVFEKEKLEDLTGLSQETLRYYEIPRKYMASWWRYIKDL